MGRCRTPTVLWTRSIVPAVGLGISRRIHSPHHHMGDWTQKQCRQHMEEDKSTRPLREPELDPTSRSYTPSTHPPL